MPDKRAARNIRKMKDRRVIDRYELEVARKHLSYRDEMSQFVMTPPNFFDMIMGIPRPMPRFPDMPPLPAVKGYTGLNAEKVAERLRHLGIEY